MQQNKHLYLVMLTHLKIFLKMDGYWKRLCAPSIAEIPPLESDVLTAAPTACHTVREFIDYKTSMITDEDPMGGLLFY